eukprot:TRINITY_DN39422_c0_g1_i1.p2 TRINITY_DN39422_c0_g1~~TRINITY_DN39422_c0_g1_i1.p2  ORF type:complete len:220 (+),score=53.64 TRINITY_DN39422_c0_g1_i1:171-830(+)
MPIVYALVARGTIVLAEFSALAGNVSSVARRILEKLEHDGETRLSYMIDTNVFHVLMEEGGPLVFLCMADQQFGKRIPFVFLEDIQMRFLSTYGAQAHTALAYAMNDEFSRTLSQQMEYFANSDILARVGREVRETKAVMIQTIDKVLDRGEKIELLVDKTSVLSDNTFRFKRNAASLKRALWWKNAKLLLMLSAAGVLLLYFLIAAFCGGLLLSSCRR